MNTSIDYLPTTIKPLSLQAATWSYLTNPYALRAEGCKLDSGEQNCSKSCRSVDDIFKSGPTFENCLAYPLISRVLGAINASASEPAIETYGVVPNDVDGSRNITITVSNCFLGYVRTLPGCELNAEGICTGSKFAGCPQALEETNSTGIFPFDLSNPSQTSTYECINSLCNDVAANSQVSADVGGIGVWISYIFQMAFCLVVWLVVEYFRFVHPFIVRWLQKKNRAVSKHYGRRQEEMFIESVIDFHKCQCYFMSTILLAAIIATQEGGLGALTLQDIFTNLVLLSLLSIGGSLPVMFILFKLRLMGHKSWFSFILSTITLALSFGLVWSSGPHKTISNSLLEPGAFSIPNCGTISPIQLCLQGFESVWAPGPGTTEKDTAILYSTIYFRTYAAFGLSFIFWIGLLVDRFLEIDAEMIEKKIFHRSGTSAEPTKKMLGGLTRKQWVIVLTRTIDFLGCVGTVYILAIYVQDLARFGIGSKEWTFGQIVALTIWIPPLAQYCYLQIHGLEGNRWHLPKTLEVTRQITKHRSGSRNPSIHSQQRHSTNLNGSHAMQGNSSRPSSGVSYTKVPAQRHGSRMSDHSIGRASDTRYNDRDPERIYASDREKGSFTELDDYNVGHS